jgi:hypothetical protein
MKRKTLSTELWITGLLKPRNVIITNGKHSLSAWLNTNYEYPVNAWKRTSLFQIISNEKTLLLKPAAIACNNKFLQTMSF